jgi:glycosyltransferase involved in cell wall biosynthesis
MVVVGIMGNYFFGKRIIDSLKDKMPIVFLYTGLTDLSYKKKIKDVEIIHYIGSPTVSFHGILVLLRLKIHKKKIIVHWIGADSWIASNRKLPQIFTKLFKNQITLHVSIEKEIAVRIKKLGIKSIIHPLPVATHFKLEPLPIEKRILVYAPDEEEYYWTRFNGEIIKKIVKEFSDVQFIIARNSGRYFNEPNVECHEWIDDMKEVYKKIIAVVRISTHDGQPGTIIEALSMGRHFIYSQEFPHCEKATNYDELKKSLKKILTKPKLNIEGSKFVNEEYNIKKIASGLEKIYKSIY